MMSNIPELKLGLVSVSRDCFPMALSVGRRDALAAAYAKYGMLHNCPVCIESETDVAPALADLKAAGVNALVIFLGNFGPETAETTLAKQFDGPVMFCAAAEESGDSLLDGRGDAFSTDNTEVLAWAKTNKGFKVGITKLGDEDTIAPAVQKGNKELLDWINDEIVKLGKENFFHKDYEETLKPVYGSDVNPDDIVVEGGQL